MLAIAGGAAALSRCVKDCLAARGDGRAPSRAHTENRRRARRSSLAASALETRCAAVVFAANAFFSLRWLTLSRLSLLRRFLAQRLRASASATDRSFVSFEISSRQHGWRTLLACVGSFVAANRSFSSPEL